MLLTLTVSFDTYGGIYLDLLFGEELTGLGDRELDGRESVCLVEMGWLCISICFEKLTLIGHGFAFCEEKV